MVAMLSRSTATVDQRERRVQLYERGRLQPASALTAVRPWRPIRPRKPRPRAARRARRRLPRRAARLDDHGRQLPHRRVVEDSGDRQIDADALLDPGEHLQREQRVAAEVEEVVVNPDPVDRQHLAPDRRQHFLHRTSRAPRMERSRSGRSPSGAGSARRSSFRFGVVGKDVELHERRRDHVRRQPGPAQPSQLLDLDRTSVGQHHVCDEPLVAGGALVHGSRRAADVRDARRGPPRSPPARSGTRGASPGDRRGRGTRVCRLRATDQVAGAVQPRPRIRRRTDSRTNFSAVSSGRSR